MTQSNSEVGARETGNSECTSAVVLRISGEGISPTYGEFKKLSKKKDVCPGYLASRNLVFLGVLLSWMLVRLQL